MTSSEKMLKQGFGIRSFGGRMVFAALLVTLAFIAFPGTSTARVFKVLGPLNYARTRSAPAPEVYRFRVQDPGTSQFTLHLFYAGAQEDFKRATPGALVTLNGKTVATPDEFGRNVHYIRKQVTLADENTLSVELRGAPGSGIRALITGRNEESQVVHFGDIILPDGRNLFGQDLDYFWTVVKKPEEATAFLSDSRSSEPSLRVDVAGEYVLELRVRTALWESEPFFITLTATQAETFVPVPVQTRHISGSGTGYQDYAIQVGDRMHYAPPPDSCGSPINSGFQVLVLDRATLAVTNHQTYNVPCGVSAMSSMLSSLDSSSIVIVSSLASTYSRCDSTCMVLNSTLAQFGSTLAFTSVLPLSYTTLDGTPVPFTYSLIGSRGLSSLEGAELNTTDHHFYKPDSRMNSNISGYFVRDVNTEDLVHRWTFAYPEFVEIATRAQYHPAANTMMVGETSYPSNALNPEAAGGFQVVILDKDTLNVPAYFQVNNMSNNRTFSTNCGAGSGSVGWQEQQAMYDFLYTLVSTHPQKFVVLIASIGIPINDKSTVFTDLIKLIGNSYGGTIGVLNQLGTSPTSISTYSLVGLNKTNMTPYDLGALDTVEASSTVASTSKEELRVVMRKDRKGWFTPVVSSTGDSPANGGPDFTLLSVALQPHTPWPLPDASSSLFQEQAAAYAYISRRVGENTDNIRSFYTLSPSNPGDWKNACDNLDYPAAPSPYFSPEVFAAMKAQLSAEFNYLSHVNGFLEKMDYVLLNMQVSSTTNLGQVYQAVRDSVHVPDGNVIRYDTGIIIRGLLTAGTSIVTTPTIKGIMGVVNGAMSIAMSLSKKPSGPDYTAIDAQASVLKDEMNRLWANCKMGKNVVLDMVKSDWGKLQYVGNKFMTAPEQGGWKFYDTEPEEWVTIITNALEAYYFQALIPAVFKIDYLLDTTTIPSPPDFEYNAGGNWTCNPYCSGVSDTAYWVDHFPNGHYSWYVLENGIQMAAMSGCGYVVFDDSKTVRDVLFGEGPWGGGVKLNLSQAVFYERWLPASVYRVPTMPLFDEVTGHYDKCGE